LDITDRWCEALNREALNREALNREALNREALNREAELHALLDGFNVLTF
jgi:hypothetical protein